MKHIHSRISMETPTAELSDDSQIIRRTDVLCGRGKVDHGTCSVCTSLFILFSADSFPVHFQAKPVLLFLLSLILLSFLGDARLVGNAYFRQAVAARLGDYKRYQQEKDRQGMSSVVQSIIDHVHGSGGRFIDQNWRGMVSSYFCVLGDWLCGEHFGSCLRISIWLILIDCLVSPTL